MVRRVTVRTREGLIDSRGEAVKHDAVDLGVKSIEKVAVSDVYLFEGDITDSEIQTIAGELLTDPVTQVSVIDAIPEEDGRIVEVAFNHGVMDPREDSINKSIGDLDITTVETSKTMKRYAITGSITDDETTLVTEKLLVNHIVQHAATTDEEPFLHTKRIEDFERVELEMLSLDDDGLLALSADRFLSLNLDEMRELQKYYKGINRNPSDIELETFAQTWSEHCVHKTFRGVIDFNGEKIDNLIKQTIFKATADIDHPMCVSVFKDNSGVVRFDEDDNVCFKVETHNFPSSLEPYGGAGTGIGGVIRDILGTGLGAKPIANTDVFCFAPPDMSFEDCPPGTLHPRRIMKGVVGGVRDYGNRMGIPTVNGSVSFDPRYVGNPLVYCGTVGIMPQEASFNLVSDGDVIVVAGGRTGRDGIHGATLSSTEVTEESETTSSHAVQIGNAIQEKKVTDTLIQARDRGLYSALTDCGAGGLSSAVGEMGEETGAVVDLDKVPLKYAGLNYWEIWVSEAQERMVFAVPPENVDELLEVFASENVEATVIGTFTGNGTLTLRYRGVTVGEFDCEFLHGGVPRMTRTATWAPQTLPEPDSDCPSDLGEPLKKILGSYNTCSKEWMIRQYDHEVQGGSVVKPLTGASNDGPSDAAVVRPKLNSDKGVAISNGINTRFGDIDPYHMAMSVIDEALRQITAVGGDITNTCLLDNFAWGNTTIPDRLGDLVRASQGCYDGAVGFGTPFVSGKDSLRNEFHYGDKVVRIPPTLLISALGIMEDVTRSVTMDLKRPGSKIGVVGLTKDELGGSEYWALDGFLGNSVPTVDVEVAKKTMTTLHGTMTDGLVLSCHDCSDGGLGVALAEMAFAGETGVEIDLAAVPQVDGMSDDHILFSESNSRFIIEVTPGNASKIEALLSDVPFAWVGRATKSEKVVVNGSTGTAVVDEEFAALKEAWQSTLLSV